MSNKVSNHLFELIKSLNKSEKRYFKLFSSRHTIGEENGYLKLFDFIDRMDTYQEDLIFMHFKGQALLNKFSITKARLYSNILRSLDSFNANTSHDAQLFRSIHCADILYNKGLYKQCEKLLKSAEKQAKKYERFNILLEVKQKQKKLIENELYTEIQAAQITKMFEEEKALIDEIQTYHQLWNVKSLLFQEINLKGNVRSEKDTLKLKELVDRIAGIDVRKYSVKINYLYHHIHGAYYFSVNDLECSYHHLHSNLVLLEDDATTFKNRPNLYFSLLTNIIYVSTRLKKYEEGYLTNDQIKSISQDLGVTEDEVKQMEGRVFNQDFSLNTPLNDENDSEWIDQVEDDNIDVVTRVEERDELDKRKALYNQAVKKLEPRELEILTARRLDEEPKTLEDLSQKYSISRERVRQIENKAIKKLQEEIKLISETKLLPKN